MPHTSTARSSATRASTSASPSQSTTRCSCPSSSMPTGSRSPRSPRTRERLADAARRRALARRPARRHVHGLESRHVRRRVVHRDHRSAAGRDPRGRRRSAGTVRRRPRPRRLPRSHDRHAHAAIIGSSTAPTARSSCPGSASCSSNRSRSPRDLDDERTLTCRHSHFAPRSATRSTKSWPPTSA